MYIYVCVCIAEFLFYLIHRKQTVFRATWPETRGTRGHEEEIHSFIRPRESKFLRPIFDGEKWVREATVLQRGRERGKDRITREDCRLQLSKIPFVLLSMQQ